MRAANPRAFSRTPLTIDDVLLAPSPARTGFAIAGIGPGEVHVAEIYHSFTYIVLTTLEDLGLCNKGRG